MNKLVKLTEDQKNELIRMAESGRLVVDHQAQVNSVNDTTFYATSLQETLLLKVMERKKTLDGYSESVISKITRDNIGPVLSKICRYNGWVSEFYSVAEHCVHLYDYLTARGEPIMAIYALLHELTEMIYGDLISPFKKHVKFTDLNRDNISLHDLEVEYLPVVMVQALGNPLAQFIMNQMPVEQAMIALHEYDVAIRHNETAVLGRNGDQAQGLTGVTIHAWTPQQASAEFKKRLDSWIQTNWSSIA